MSLELVPRGTPLFDAIPQETVRAWILERNSLPFRNVPGITEDGWVAYHLDDIRCAHEKDGALTYFDPAMPCLIMARQLAWDTEVLGIPSISLDHFLFPSGTETDAAVARLNEVCRQWRDDGLRLLIHKTSPANHAVIATMAPAGFDLLCNHIDYLSDGEKAAALYTPLDGFEFGPARADEVEDVARLSQNNFAPMDRFNIDPVVPRDRVPVVYYEWGRNACRGFADLVWVGRYEGRVIGLTFWSHRPRLKQIAGVACEMIQLAAVDSRYRGKGVFRRLLASVLMHLNASGTRWGTIPTNVTNYPMQRSIQAVGCVIHDSVFTFRKDLQR
ncbi:MAG: GNAT family N-acetyltransferase [Candidatus Hydrogenedentes bacterium]|nr:GNAT family N-acetyltransferase [Candidatus Hydrogenedentota bacterium]